MTQFDPRSSNSYGNEGNLDRQAQENQQADGNTQVANQQAGRSAEASRVYGQTATSYNQQPQQNQSYQTADNGGQSVSTSGTEDSSPRKRFPKVLEGHPLLNMEDDTRELYERHRINRANDREVDSHDGLSALYEALAKTNPTSATYDPPPHTYVPMPRGGLDVIVRQHLGPRPADAPYDATRQERADAVKAQQEYDKQASVYKHLLYRFNQDTLRSDDRYIIGQPVRVFTEGL